MAKSPLKVFLVGVGFVGEEILELLLADGYQVTALVRRENHAAELDKLGVKTKLGDLSNEALLTEQTRLSDIVINSASSDDVPSVGAILQGIKDRAASGKSTIYLHTSGCGEIVDFSNGNVKGEKIFYDDKSEDIDALPDDAPHRNVDLTIIKAREELGRAAKLAIIMPPLIYGVAQRSKRLSIQLPLLTRFAIKHGYAGHVGGGLGLWGQIHVQDLARAYMTILHHLESDKSDDIYSNPYYFTENGEELSWKECAVEIGKILHSAGLIPDAEPKTIPENSFGDIMGPWTPIAVGANARNRANRLRALGWTAKEKDTLSSLREDEIPIILSEKRS